ncbi:hypothetical protein NIES2135_27070 [Leptolyngbya boryana NIES-2135]|jgi:hypothetical protein|uniref:Uncharacterized protein n=1 Tax=Leptolyngbya boryana NIES-2135 TaxID=1973484 RepID=A0A1Z4JGJ0_LEPBY|nr:MULTISPECIES: hypothetical protein [Leptolyngbya]BAY55882.1 hypothetical protein NIES2135_27070 [Leptolyngbya boryana NIES-2135]MBD2368813.1 hypothetical protein [Leptolyngbya sp. FACHB-161]MBD2375319.1 hypothetical protein [Leptolyngbya sp. FACHB-238]MBD2399737.1 hypothetical protein [Leptolyngbya sp. FACHB-239]MBD2405943.1 hypothetical protein [Leptolyngbya sp. FACHB-402]
MTQLLKPIDYSEIKHLEVDLRFSTEELENILYGSNCPQKNRTFPRNPSPDELRNKGYQDGFRGVNSQSFCDNPFYDEGWKLGYSDYKKKQILDRGLVVVLQLTDIDNAIAQQNDWATRAQDGEVVELTFMTDFREYWLCASQSLVDRVLQF